MYKRRHSAVPFPSPALASCLVKGAGGAGPCCADAALGRKHHMRACRAPALYCCRKEAEPSYPEAAAEKPLPGAGEPPASVPAEYAKV